MKFTKRLLSVLLVLCFVFAVGCSKQEDAPSEDTKSEDTQSTEESLPEEGKPSTEYTEKIDSMLSKEDLKKYKSKNVLLGKKYESSMDVSKEYPDDGTVLTDGNIPSAFSNNPNIWAGYHTGGTRKLEITFDLGKEVDNLLDFHAYVLNMPDYGVREARKAVVSVAGEDGKYVDIGTALPADFLGINEVWDYAIFLQGGVKARYIKYSFEKIKSAWFFLGEISVYRYSEDNGKEGEDAPDSDEYYGNSTIEEVKTPEYWDESEKDFNDRINLLSGRAGLMTATDAITGEIATNWYNPKDMTCLTDGKYAENASYSDSRWLHMARGGDRSITFDLGKTSTVESFRAGFLLDKDAGVNFPRFVTVSISENGKDWQTLFSQKSISSSKSKDIVRIDEKFDGRHKARFVRISFLVSIHCYLDEFEVFGTKAIQNGAADVKPNDDTAEAIRKNKYITPDMFCDVHNLLLSYNCRRGSDGKQDEGGLITKEEYLPYVAYLDTDGNIKDTFFDAFLYLPYTAYNYSDYAKTADGWKFYLDNIYTPERNMDALNTCVGEVSSALNMSDYKVKVFSSILYTFKENGAGTANPFGDIDGDGKDESFSNIKDRKKAIKWMIDETYSRFKKGGYDNLDFCGFYWFEESIDYSDEDETELIKFASDYVHSLGLKLFWIPYHLASGYNEWEELGFDLACMQPNYMFSDKATKDVLYSNAKATKIYGMCVEIEFEGFSNKDRIRKYEEYLIAGWQTGYMNAVKMYYQGGVPGEFYNASQSKDPLVRKSYDDTYLYAKEKFVLKDISNIEIAKEPVKASGKVNEEIKGKIDVSEFRDGGKITVTLSPKYGSVKLNISGDFIYFPPENYKGSDYFEVSVDYGYGKTKPLKVEITIG